MADQHHFDVLTKGVGSWNQWRVDNPEALPDFSYADLTGVDLRGADLRLSDLSGANLMRANLSMARLDNTELRGANLFGATLSVADLANARLGKANLSRANLIGARLTRAELHTSNLTNADLTGADLVNANLFEADLFGANLTKTDLREANLRGANLTQARLVETNFEKANLDGCRVYGVSAWNVRLEGADQSNLIITRLGEPSITTDNLEMAQFVYLLLNNEKLRSVIDAITSKAVLILGRFTSERKRILDAIREELRKSNWLPILFDFDKPASRNITETISTLAHISRFVIADITDARSIPQELAHIIPFLPSVPIQPLLQASANEYGMFEHFREYPWVLQVYRYAGIEDLLTSLQREVIDPAEAMARQLRKC